MASPIPELAASRGGVSRDAVTVLRPDGVSIHFKMELIEGSSIDPEIIQQVRSHVDGVDRVLVSLDSSHTHEHVLAVLMV